MDRFRLVDLAQLLVDTAEAYEIARIHNATEDMRYITNEILQTLEDE